MNADLIQRAVAIHFGVRLGPEVSRYVARQLTRPLPTFEVLGVDARTGVPCRAVLDVARLKAALQP